MKIRLNGLVEKETERMYNMVTKKQNQEMLDAIEGTLDIKRALKRIAKEVGASNVELKMTNTKNGKSKIIKYKEKQNEKTK